MHSYFRSAQTHGRAADGRPGTAGALLILPPHTIGGFRGTRADFIRRRFSDSVIPAISGHRIAATGILPLDASTGTGTDARGISVRPIITTGRTGIPGPFWVFSSAGDKTAVPATPYAFVSHPTRPLDTASSPLKRLSKHNRIRNGSGEPYLLAVVTDIEKQMIAQALARHHWHRSRAAVQLGIDRKTLFSKIKRYQLECCRSGLDAKDVFVSSPYRADACIEAARSPRACPTANAKAERPSGTPYKLGAFTPHTVHI